MVDHGPGPWLTMVDHGQRPWLTMFKDHGKRTKKSKIQFKMKVAFISWNANIDMQILFHTIIMKSSDPLRAKKIYIRKKLGHTAVSAIKASSVTL